MSLRKKLLIGAGALVALIVLMVVIATFTVGRGYHNEPLKAWNPDTGYRHSLFEYVQGPDDMVLALAFSGGGTRAAAFAYGVLEELRDTEVIIDGQTTRLIDEVDFVTGVSGGSFTATYFALHGEGIFADFERRFLKRDIEKELILSLVSSPRNWFRLLSRHYNLSDLAADYYDREVFDGATFGDIQDRGGAKVVINATDLSTGNPFHFVQDQFDFICSDLTRFPVARAVAASAGLPPYFPPLVLDNYSGNCGFRMPTWLERTLEAGRTSFDRRSVGARILASYLNPSVRPYIHLIDGGYSDYFGIRNPLTAAGAPADFRGQSRLPRRIIAIVVNAQRESEESWGEIDRMSSVSSVFPIIANVQIDRYSVETLELLRSNFRLWQERAKAAGALMDFHIIEVDFVAARDQAERDYLNHVPTTLTLPADDVDRLREAARTILRRSPEFQKLRVALSKPVRLPDQQ